MQNHVKSDVFPGFVFFPTQQFLLSYFTIYISIVFHLYFAVSRHIIPQPQTTKWNWAPPLTWGPKQLEKEKCYRDELFSENLYLAYIIF